MKCQAVQLPDGGRAIVCGERPRAKCWVCGQPAGLLCDWKVRGGTCDRPLCERCSLSPAPGKDLCPRHAEAFRQWREQRSTGRD